MFVGTRWNSQLGVFDFKVTGRSKITQQEYNAMIEKEVAEIRGNYGPRFQIWFDGGGYGPGTGGPDVLSIVEKLQPDIHFYHNHDRADYHRGGTETGTVPYPCRGPDSKGVRPPRSRSYFNLSKAWHVQGLWLARGVQFPRQRILDRGRS